MFEAFLGPEKPLLWVTRFYPALIAAFVSSLAATWLCKKIAIKCGIVDKPDDLVKTHKEPIAYLGGVGILVGLTVGVLYGLVLIRREEFFPQSTVWLLGILAGAAVACFIGLMDDIFDIKPIQKIGGQLLAAVILLLAGVMPNLDFVQAQLGIPINNAFQTFLEGALVVAFVLGATNSLNLLDGLDGLCAGVTAIITIAMLLVAIHLATWGFSDIGDPVRIVICLALIGGVFGFLPFNRYPAKIFMGDAGSMLLGFVIAALMILFAEGIPRWWLASIVVFGLPILDTAVALIRRLINKRPLFISDRGHIYDQMIDRGMPLKKTVAICYLLAGLYAILGLLMSQVRTRYTGVMALIIAVVSLLTVWKKGYFKMRGIRGAIQAEQKDS